MDHALSLASTDPARLQALDVATSRALDRAAFEELGLPTLVLMEHAAHGAARVLTENLQPRRSNAGSADVLILCGAGNNGGDGLALCRLLAPRAKAVVTARPDPQRSPDAALQLEVLERAGIAVEVGVDSARLEALADGCSWIVDALLGTGLEAAPRGLCATWITWLAGRKERVLALDLPSGLDADSGRAFDPCVRASMTVSFARPKLGHFRGDGPARCGELRVVTIGLPEPWVEERTQPSR